MNLERIAVFISPHGFGHAARSCAVLNSLFRLNPNLQVDLYTQVPQWFFQQSLSAPFRYHPVNSDIGLIQHSPIREDIPATLAALKQYIPFSATLLTDLAEAVSGSDLVMADISPMGLCVAHKAGIPSVLLENFTWDWIYRGFNQNRDFDFAIDYFSGCFELATWRIQTEPVCQVRDADLNCGPISRTPRCTPAELKSRLALAQDARLCLVTLGGIPLADTAFVDRLENMPENVVVLIPGAADQEERRGSLILLPRQSVYYHPDLVYAADWVVAKLGYSTVAEVCASNSQLLYLNRPGFRESAVLEAFVKEQLGARQLDEAAFVSGQWSRQLALRVQPLFRKRVPQSGAADEVADFLMRCVVR